jgi:hypothetical protein
MNDISTMDSHSFQQSPDDWIFITAIGRRDCVSGAGMAAKAVPGQA